MVSLNPSGQMTSEELIKSVLNLLSKELTHWNQCMNCSNASLSSEAHRLARLA